MSTQPNTTSSSPTLHPSGKSYSKNGYDSGAAQSQRREQSRIAYEAGAAPKPSYRTPGGVQKPIEPSAPEVRYVRRVVTPEIWRSRPTRIGYVYSPWFGYPTIVYNDPYNSFFWYWLLSRSVDSQANWAYHHRYSMDQRRYDDLMGRNAELAARVKQLEEKKVTRDSSYTPDGIDPDLVYADDYVDAAYNPQAVEVDEPTPTEARHSGTGIVLNRAVRQTWRTIWRGLFAIVATFGVSFLIIWLVFVKRWGGDQPVRASEAAARGRHRPHPFRRNRH